LKFDHQKRATVFMKYFWLPEFKIILICISTMPSNILCISIICYITVYVYVSWIYIYVIWIYVIILLCSYLCLLTVYCTPCMYSILYTLYVVHSYSVQYCIVLLVVQWTRITYFINVTVCDLYVTFCNWFCYNCW